MPISAIDTITLAFEHTKRQLVQPFRFWQWTRLAIVGLLAGEMGSSGSFNFPTNFNLPQQGGSSRHLLAESFPKIDPAILGTLIVILVVSGLIFLLVMTYLSSVMRFILFDSVLTKECHIRAGWSRRQSPGWNYFLWQLGLLVITLVGAIVLLGLPAAFAYGMGWFSHPGDHVLALVLSGIIVFCVLMAFFITLIVVQVLTKDFVIPQMALEGIDAIEGWRRLWQLIDAERKGYAIYIGMKIVLAIGTGIAVGIASLILIFLIAIPVVGVVIAGVFAGKSAGLTWNAGTITLAIVAGCIVIAIFLYSVALISVPAIVFFPAYAMYFFAPRYRPLSLALYPPRTVEATPDTPPPQFPPPLPPTPEPAV